MECRKLSGDCGVYSIGLVNEVYSMPQNAANEMWTASASIQGFVGDWRSIQIRNVADEISK